MEQMEMNPTKSETVSGYEMKRLSFDKFKLNLITFLGITFLFSIHLQAGQIVVPNKTLYHAGSYDILMKNIRNHNVPVDDWNQYIMGDKNTSLPIWRRGLYGAETLMMTYEYSYNQIEKGKPHWFMKIQIKDECLTQASVDPAFFYIHSNFAKMRFTEWYLSKNGKYKDIEKQCVFKMASSDLDNWNTSPGYDLDKASEDVQKRTAVCSTVLNDYFNENHIAISLDTFWGEYYNASWFIRDRNCIANITGTANDWFQDLFVEKNYGSSDQSSINSLIGNAEYGVHPFVVLLFMMQILEETTLLNQNQIPVLAAWVDDFQSTYQYELENNYEHFVRIKKLVKMAISSIKNKKVGEFQKGLAEALPLLRNNYSSVFKKMKSLNDNPVSSANDKLKLQCEENGRLAEERIIKNFYSKLNGKKKSSVR